MGCIAMIDTFGEIVVNTAKPKRDVVDSRQKREKTEEVNISIDLSVDNALKAMIYSEIFGKPRCKRKRRW